MQVGLKGLLTGATGSLGSHVLHQMLCDARVRHIFLLVRGTSTDGSRERVIKALHNRGLDIPPNFDSKTAIRSGKLSEPNLGLVASNYERFAGNVDLVLHLAWSVNFLISLRTIAGAHLSGLHNLLDLALQQPSSSDKPLPRFIFCSSIAAVSNFGSLATPGDIPEKFLPDPRISGPTGYARSKWVGEAICAEAHKSTRLRDCISVARVGQLSGATDTGVWSKSEAYPLLLSSAKVTGVLPDLEDEILNWLSVDVAARAFVETALCGPSNTRTTTSNRSEIPVHHVLNPNMTVRWPDLVRWISPHASFEVVPVNEWLSRLAALQDDERTKHDPALRLLEFWRAVYGSEPGTSGKHSDDEKDGQPSEGKRGY